MKTCIVPKSHLHKFEPVPFVQLGVCRRRGESGGKKRLATECKSIEKAAKLRRRLQRKKKKREKRADPPTAH